LFTLVSNVKLKNIHSAPCQTLLPDSQSGPSTLLHSREEAISLMNHYGKKGQPFLFLISYDQQQSQILRPDEIGEGQLRYNFNGNANQHPAFLPRPLIFEQKPVSYERYLTAFNQISREIGAGNSYLVNLTFETPIYTNYSLHELYAVSQARYKLLIPGQFLVFSPEPFIKISGGNIAAYPMKGTINAAERDAREKILSNRKEMAEHATIVDLLRNDLAMVAEKVEVTRFRYLDQIRTPEKTLLQVSSEITGKLSETYREHLGDILFTLLPAGSISGAPKLKTLEIIGQAESHQRGFYCGICGYFDGKNLDSGVMIRFIEKRGDHLYYKSGGGITSQSDPLLEYREYQDKIYVPID
jgi:para-aminobenzoate synthetase component I